MGSLLNNNRLYKKIPPFQDTFSSKYNMFIQRLSQKYEIDKKYLDTIREIHDIIKKHKQSPVEFRRKDAFVICADNYNIETITLEKIRSYLTLTKEFHNIIDKILNKEMFINKASLH
jgi:hypothetical protein